MVSNTTSAISVQADGTNARRSSLSGASSESDEAKISDNYAFLQKLKAGLQWTVDPFRKYCVSTRLHNETPQNYPMKSVHLKPELNRVNGLLKHFAFGVMFTNGILGFLLFVIGLWSSLEHRKINSMPDVETSNRASLNPFKFLGIVVCILGLSFFLLAIISCLGINRENLNLLRISLIGQCLALVVFLGVAIAILAWADKIRYRIVEGMLTGLKFYYHIDEAWATFFDKLHLNYFCCGVYSFDDWNSNPHYTCTAANLQQSFDACAVPFTCCKTQKTTNQPKSVPNSLNHACGANALPSENRTINMDDLHQRIHVNGCFDEILPIIQQLVITAAIFMLLICIIVVITIFLTCLISFDIRLTVANVKRYYRKQSDIVDETSPSEKEETDRF